MGSQNQQEKKKKREREESRISKILPIGLKGSFPRVDFNFRKKGEMRNLFVSLASYKQLKLRALHINEF